MPSHVSPPPSGRGFAFRELLVSMFCTALLLSMVLPGVARGRALSLGEVSLGNLTTLGAAHAIYAMDWNGRQVSVIDDDIASYGSTAPEAFGAFAAETGSDHPALVLGWGDLDGHAVLFAYRQGPGWTGNHPLVQPIAFHGFAQYFGSFRLPNPRPLHGYLGGRFYEPVFYAPANTIVYPLVEPAFADPAEYVHGLPGIGDALGDIPAWSSYCWSPAAHFHADVFTAPPDGGWRDPWSLPHGFATPGLFHAEYPSLKTQMLEHHWLQNSLTDPCNPGFSPGTYAGCEPYYFNHGFASEPATLFYDLSVRFLPNTEAVAADAQITKETGYGLWSRDTSFGNAGYLNDYSYDLVNTSHHILTTGGITGRDTVNGRRTRPYPAPSTAALQP